MKIGKMITLDVDLVLKLTELKFNVSDECNQYLWTKITEIEGNIKDKRKPEHIDMEIRQLQKQKDSYEKEQEQKVDMKKAGITPKAMKFLKAMSTSYGAVKNNKQSWLNITGQTLSWDELMALKEKWA